MGNYYEGDMIFILRNDMPKELVNDLYHVNNLAREHDVIEGFHILKDTKWFKHQRFHYPQYQFTKHESDNCSVYELFITFNMKGYIDDNGNDLGQAIYNVLKPYIDTTAYDISNGICIGRIYDEDGTYNKTFYADEDQFMEEMKKRKYLCNRQCVDYSENHLCSQYAKCRRAYVHGFEDGEDGIVHKGLNL